MQTYTPTAWRWVIVTVALAVLFAVAAFLVWQHWPASREDPLLGVVMFALGAIASTSLDWPIPVVVDDSADADEPAGVIAHWSADDR